MSVLDPSYSASLHPLTECIVSNIKHADSEIRESLHTIEFACMQTAKPVYNAGFVFVNQAYISIDYAAGMVWCTIRSPRREDGCYDIWYLYGQGLYQWTLKSARRTTDPITHGAHTTTQDYCMVFEIPVQIIDELTMIYGAAKN